MSAHNTGIAIENYRMRCGLSIKHSQPGTVSLELWFL